MKVYVSAPSSFLSLAIEAMHKVRLAGHEITHDWTVAVQQDRESPFTDAQLARSGLDDIQGVREAEVVIVMVTRAGGPMIDCAVEIGAALALGKRIILVELVPLADGPWEHHPFRHCCTHRVHNLEEALALMEGR